MNEAIRRLLKLQEIDGEIRDLDQAAATHPARLAEIEGDLGADRARSDALSAELDELDKQRRNVEGQIQLQKDQVRKWEARLADIKTPREYAALSREIDIAKKSMKNQEEEVLNLMEQAESLRNEVEKVERTMLEKEKGYEGERSGLKAQMESLDADRRRLMEQRTAASEGIERRMLSRYDLIRSRRGGIALAPVLPGGTCGACRMRILPQVYNDLVTGRAELTQCGSCNRILYVPDTDEGGDEAEA